MIKFVNIMSFDIQEIFGLLIYWILTQNAKFKKNVT